MSERLRRDEIPEREGQTMLNSFLREEILNERLRKLSDRAKTSFSLSVASYRQVKMCSKKPSTHAPISGWLFKIRFLSKLPAS